MSKASAKILEALSKEHKELFAKRLNSTNYFELLGIASIGRLTLQNLLHPYRFYFDEEGEIRCIDDPFTTLPWPTFTAVPYGIVYRLFPTGNLRNLSHNLTRPALLRLLNHFQIHVQDVNEHLTELRDIKLRLELFRHMGNPVVDDYLKDLIYQLRYDL